jgi:hypothetical protein
MARMGVSRVTVDFLHLDNARGENNYDLQVAYTIQVCFCRHLDYYPTPL